MRLSFAAMLGLSGMKRYDRLVVDPQIPTRICHEYSSCRTLDAPTQSWCFYCNLCKKRPLTREVFGSGWPVEVRSQNMKRLECRVSSLCKPRSSNGWPLVVWHISKCFKHGQLWNPIAFHFFWWFLMVSRDFFFWFMLSQLNIFSPPEEGQPPENPAKVFQVTGRTGPNWSGFLNLLVTWCYCRSYRIL